MRRVSTISPAGTFDAATASDRVILDADNRQRVIELLVERARAGCTVIAATHDDYGEIIGHCARMHLDDQSPVSPFLFRKLEH